MKVGLIIHKGRTKYMTNYIDSEDIKGSPFGNQDIWRKSPKQARGRKKQRNKIQTPWKNYTSKRYNKKKKNYARIRAVWSCLEKDNDFRTDNSPYHYHYIKKKKKTHTNKQVMDQCVLLTMAYGCKTWSLNTQLTNKPRTAQREINREENVNLNQQNKVLCSEARKRTNCS